MRSQNERNEILPTDLSVEFSDDFPKNWNRGDYISSYVMNAFSLCFPQGEQFFIDSVKPYLSKIDDPRLKKDVIGFIGQEQMHTLKHIELNKQFDTKGYRWVRIFSEKYLASVFYIFGKLPRRWMLATTVALEHLTASLSERWLDDEEMVFEQNENIRPIMIWHCIEEIEHKAVCFDIYNKFGGSYIERSIFFLVVLILFSITISLLIFFQAVVDMVIFNPYHMVKGFWYQMGWNGFYSMAVVRSMTILKPKFHPWDQDTTYLMDKWKSHLGSRRIQGRFKEKSLQSKVS